MIRFKTTTDHKAKIERAAEKRGITVSEYLRQSVNAKLSRERPHGSPYLGDKQIAFVTTADVQRMYNKLKKSKRSLAPSF